MIRPAISLRCYSNSLETDWGCSKFPAHRFHVAVCQVEIVGAERPLDGFLLSGSVSCR